MARRGKRAAGGKGSSGGGVISHGVVAVNRKARFNYEITEKFEAGIVLYGSEVKSLRYGRVSIGDAYAADRNGELFLVGCDIPVYAIAGVQTHSPLRQRKLLLHRREIKRLIGEIARGGMTLVPLEVRFNRKGMAKLTLGLARGKQQHDKRQAIKQREWDRDKRRILKGSA